MSWVDKAHKKNQIHKAVENAMKDPRMIEAMKKNQEEAFSKALDMFLLIAVDYLFRTFRCKKDGVLKFIDFFVKQVNYAAADEKYFELLNEELVRDTGVNVLRNRLEKTEKLQKEKQEAAK